MKHDGHVFLRQQVRERIAFAIGEPDEVLTTERLSELYGTTVEVLRLGERIIVAAGEDGGASSLLGHHHDHDHEDVVWD